jgi:isopenicillin N synthase-like dioxygenase
MKNVPVIDITKIPRELNFLDLQNQIDTACREWGFLVVSGHGVSENLIKKMFKTSYDFFDLPEEEKQKYDRTDVGRGYYSVRAKALARTYGDLNAPADEKESFTIGDEIQGHPYYFTPEAQGHFTENIWPNSDMKETWSEYKTACQEVCDRLLHLMNCPLKSDKPLSTLIAHNYPEQKTKPEGIRAGAHTDFGTLTLLSTENKLGGLQVQIDGEWHNVEPEPNTFIVNLGDLMVRWNSEWRSTLHRVVNPPLNSDSRRVSIVYFHSPNYDTDVNGITAGEHLMNKFNKNKNI